MSRRSTILLPSSHDGTSQTGRALPALDPNYATIDERTSADLLAFVQAFVERLRYYGLDATGEALKEAGDWQAFAKHSDLTLADIVAYVEEPSRFTGEAARWLGRPHFALLLTFIELLGQARAQLAELTSRHLDHHYVDILRMSPAPPEPDRAAVVLRLANRVAELRLPAGTELQAGRDSSGAARIYTTERELMLNRATVAELRSVFVHREIIGIPEVRNDRSLTARGAFEGSMKLALGVPAPGDPIPAWQGTPVDLAFVVGLRGPLDFARTRLFLDHHELRTMMQRVHRREAADYEWAQINALLGVVNPAKPRDFNANLESRVGKLDFKTDGLPQVNDIDDLYEYRSDPDVRAYIDDRLKVIGYANFVALMPIKLRIDAEWAEINRLLERAGRRQRNVLSWQLVTSDPTAFDANLAKALEGKWPPPSWPWSTANVSQYEAKLRALETHMAMSVERLARLVAFAEQLGVASAAEDFDWSETDRILEDAYREHVYADRRAKLAEVRANRDNLVGFDSVVTYVLSRPNPMPEQLIGWDVARPKLDQHLDPGQLGVLDRFREQLADPNANRLYTWTDAYRVLELAQRYVEGMPDPVALKIEWRNLHAYADAKTLLDDAAYSPRWKTFGGLPVADDQHPPAPTLGLALRSPLLSLSQGKRTITLTLGLNAKGFDRDAFIRALGILPAEYSEDKLRSELAKIWIIQVETAKGWIDLPIAKTKLVNGKPGSDYWSLRGVARALDEDRPAMQLELLADPTLDPLAPQAKSPNAWPTLRLLLRPRWDEAHREWVTKLGPFEPLTLAAAHLQVDVEGLTDLRLQQDDRKLDPRKPFEPFGSRPSVGSRLYLSHPELVRARLDTLRLDIEWMGLPAYLKTQYFNYPGIYSDGGVGASFKAKLTMIDRNLELPLADTALFEDVTVDSKTTTKPKANVTIANVGTALGVNYAYTRRTELTTSNDLRGESRVLRWELTPIDFGHSSYSALAASKAREMSVALSKNQITDANPIGNYRVDPPYTPTIKQLSVTYRSSTEIDVRVANDIDRLLHIHPFGDAPVVPADPGLLPRYDQAGELYIGLRGLAAPQHLSLLLQLAEGTSDPDVEPAKVSWSCLDGDLWHDLGDGDLLYDSTRGLINSGIVELSLPSVAPSTRLPSHDHAAPQAGPLYWLRVAVERNPTSVCSAVDILAQAVSVRFDDRGNAPDHYEQPLPVASIERLVDPDARIAAVEQPFTSYGGKPGERAEFFHTRVSERLRHKQRALTPWDYERMVLQRFGQIYKVKCLPTLVGSDTGRVDVIVIPDIRGALPSDAFAPKASANLLADISSFLRDRAPAAADVRVRNAHYVPVLVRLGVRFRPGQDEGFARKRLNEDLVRFLSPWAYGESAELMIGGRIYANSILDYVDRRDYVDYVAEIKLFRGRGQDDFELIPPGIDYHVATDRPDQVLVAAHDHVIDVIPELGYQQASFTGINYMKIELDFIVG
ncbi:baseplate J/gp47 family protein [Nannocystaceae bacterium ST9]